MAHSAVGWGLVGASSWADSTFGPAVSDAENAEFVAVLSSDRQRAETFATKHGVEKAYDDLDKFVADPDIEAVWVASPNHLHLRHATAALKRGKHVLCEKPLAIGAMECQAMIDAAEAADRLLSVGYHMRHHPVHQELQQQWSEGVFGQPVCVRAQLYFASPRPPAVWRQQKATSGGWAICDIGTHLIDLLRWYLGEATEVQGILSSPRFGLETDDHALVTVRFHEGAAGVADASTGAPGPGPRLELYGTDGYCICDGTFFGGGGTVTRSDGGGDPEVAEVPAASLYQLQTESFGRSVRGESPLLVTAQDGLENVRIIEHARGW